MYFIYTHMFVCTYKIVPNYPSVKNAMIIFLFLATQNVKHKPTAFVSPGSSLELQNFRPHPLSTKSEPAS